MKFNKLHIGDCREVMELIAENSIDSIVTDPPYGISFMGKKWDYDVPGVDVWRECLRVLKPGGHILVACGTRTQHRMAVNIEDAGFEIRDLVAWVYGSGFPKSLNIGKQVDKVMGNEREEVGLSRRHNSGDFGGEKYGNYKGGIPIETKGTSEFEGWGTALKPAMELWTLARKPLTGTVAENVMEWGTGGLNIDGCRVETGDNLNGGAYSENKNSDGKWGTIHNYVGKEYNQPQGRFPANFIHDGSDEVVELFPESSVTGIRRKEHKPTPARNTPFTMGNPLAEYPNDKGSAARFFYCAKASKSERDAGLDGFDERKGDLLYRPNDDGLNGIQSRLHGATIKGSNHHPTVKPISLMRYLCRLITPPAGIVLDPFMGSGSTGCGAVLEGFGFYGIEREEEYYRIADARIKYYETQAAREKQLELF